MLVIISDIHLTDGSSGKTIHPGAFRVFRQRLRDLAYDASWRTQPGSNNLARYKPIESFDVILLGDILDVIRSNKWLTNGQKGVRPWDFDRSAEINRRLAKKVDQITSDIIRKNKDALGVIKDLSSGDNTVNCITIPPVTLDGKPDNTVGWKPDDPRRVRVEVRLHYMAGNHEWLYNIPDKLYNNIRSKIKAAMGLANDPKVPFPHDPGESADIQKVLSEHHVWARHGDIYDSYNYQNNQGRLASSLGDVIVVELVNRFSYEVDKLNVPQSLKESLKEIDNVRPLFLIPLWIDGSLRRSDADRKQIKEIKSVWDDLVDKFLEIGFVEKQNSFLNPLDDVSKLGATLKLSKGISFSALSKIVNWLGKNVPTKVESYYEEALMETAFKNRSARFIVYGHTHRNEIVPLDITKLADGKELKQVYLNTGTWRRVHTLAQSNTKDAEFIDYNIMTYLAFFKGDERHGRSFEVWSGALDV
jgi:hypothetical protein